MLNLVPKQDHEEPLELSYCENIKCVLLSWWCSSGAISGPARPVDMCGSVSAVMKVVGLRGSWV